MKLPILLAILIPGNVSFGFFSCDKDMEPQFAKQLEKISRGNDWTRETASELTRKCYKLLTYCGDGPLFITNGNYWPLDRRQVCEYLELFGGSGPGVECLESMRKRPVHDQLLKCVWDSSDDDFKQRIFNSYFTQNLDSPCESVTHNCSKSLMSPKCKSFFEDNGKVLEAADCIGAKLYSYTNLNMYYILNVYRVEKEKDGIANDTIFWK